MLEFPKAPILLLPFSTIYINDLHDDVICHVAIYADDTTLCSKFDQAFDLRQQLKLASELECDLRDTVDWSKKLLVDFNARNTQIVSSDQSNNTGAINVKMDGPALEENSSFKMLGLTFFSKLDWVSYILSVTKTVSKKVGAFIRFMKFLSPEVALYLYKSTIRRYIGILFSCLGWCP